MAGSYSASTVMTGCYAPFPTAAQPDCGNRVSDTWQRYGAAHLPANAPPRHITEKPEASEHRETRNAWRERWNKPCGTRRQAPNSKTFNFQYSTFNFPGGCGTGEGGEAAAEGVNLNAGGDAVTEALDVGDDTDHFTIGAEFLQAVEHV